MATAEETPQSFVDDAPISPIKERSNTLEHALAKRPDTIDLLNRGILHAPPGVPASVQQRQHDLERLMAKDSLKSHLEKRPEKEELIQRNILSGSHAAAALQAHQRELERSMLEDNLKEKLAARPPPEKVIEKGILNPDEDPTKI